MIRIRRQVLPLVALVAGLAATAAGAWFVESWARDRERLAFESAARSSESHLSHRIDTYVALLRSASSLFAARGQPTADEFKRFVQRLDHERLYPGVRTLGYIPSLKAAELPAAVAERRQQGARDFRVHPDGARDEYAPVTMLAPEDPSGRVALGFDVLTEPRRRAALERARDSGQPALTAVLTLTSDKDDKSDHGLIIYLPVYRGALPPGDVAERRRDIQGYLLAAFRIDAFVRGVFAQAPPAPFAIHDGPALTSPLLYDGRLAADPARALSSVGTLNLCGRTWTLEHHSTWGAPLLSTWTVARLAFGAFLSLILFALLRSEGNARRLAERRADELRNALREQQRAEAEMQTREAHFRSLIENAQDITVIIDGEGRFRYCSPAIRRALGWSPEEILGHHSAGYLHPDDRGRVMARLQQKIAVPGDLRPIELRFRHRDGSYRVLEAIGNNLLHEPAVGGIVLNCRDVTERSQLQARLMSSDRLASVGTLAAGVAHELNNPLAYVIANLSYLAEQVEAERLGQVVESRAETAKIIAEAREGAERMKVIIRDLKSFSRPDDEQRGPVEVGKVMRSAINMAWNEIRHRAQLVEDFHEVPRVRASEARLGQIFLNLLVNAAQSMPEGDLGKNRLTVAFSAQAGRVRIEVADTGCGISREALPHIFEPFFTTKPIGVGTGLGLSICHGLVTSMGGSIEVESTPGKGSTFRVWLPAAAATDAARTAAA